MGNLIFIKFEILILFISFGYITYFTLWNTHKNFFCRKKIVRWEEVEEKPVALSKLDLNTREKNYKKRELTDKLSEADKVNLVEISRRVKINISKWYIDTAKALIIEWLAIDKFNKDLNLDLANIYEKERNYQNAKYIYKDLLEVYEKDEEIMKKLAYIFAMQWKMKKSLDIYIKLHSKDPTDDDVINMLSEITYNLRDYKLCLVYIAKYLRVKPRDLDKTNMKAVCFEWLCDYENAIDSHKKILELQPYNTFSRDKIDELSELL